MLDWKTLWERLKTHWEFVVELAFLILVLMAYPGFSTFCETQFSWRSAILWTVGILGPLVTFAVGHRYLRDKKSPGWGHEREASYLLFSTIGLLLVDFQYLQILYEKRDKILSPELVPSMYGTLCDELLALSVGGVTVFCGIATILFWIEPNKSQSDPSGIFDSQKHSARSVGALIQILRAFVIVILCIHVPPMLSSARLIEEARP